MADFAAPLADMRFTLDQIVDVSRLAALPGLEAASPDVVDAVLEEAGKLAAGALAPLNHLGDQVGSHLVNGVVETPKGFAEAYQQFVEGGWISLPFSADEGGQGLPWALAFATQELWQSSNMSFGLCPMLTQGAIEALLLHASDDLKHAYLPKMITGEWAGTMNLTEPQAGSDLSQVRAKAVRDGDVYRISGQKIFITWGDHELAENIVHLTLARLPDAPAGSRGISLFVVPKFLLNADGSLGARNDVYCTSLEHKLGIKASPTAVMSFGDGDGAIGYLVGEENRGLEYMFSMMNHARLNVGLQGVAIAERAYQQARDYAQTRVQSRAVGQTQGGPGPIIKHPDVRRMLLTMKAGIEASRALAYEAGAQLDLAKYHPEEAARAAAQLRVELLTPVVKAWATDLGCEIASIGIQIHGGMGYIEETGAAQHFRDARIAPIYEGTNGIQANDLVFRKVGRDAGAAVQAFVSEARADLARLSATGDATAAVLVAALEQGLAALEETTAWVAARVKSEAPAVAAASTDYLQLFGIVAGGVMLARGAASALARLAAGEGDAGFLKAKLATARFYAEHYLPRAGGLVTIIKHGQGSVLDFPEDQF